MTTATDVIATIETALELKIGTLSESSSAENIDGWDSLGQLSILVALDKQFDGKVAAIAGMAESDSVAKIIATLKQNALL